MVESLQHDNPEHSNGEHTADPGYRIVDPGSDPDAVLRDRIHHSGRKWRYADRHADSKDDRRREKCFPVTTRDSRRNKQSKTNGCDDRTHDKGKPGAIFSDKSDRPA